MQFRPYLNGKSNISTASTEHPSEWTVAIFDISGLTGYTETTASNLYWVLYNRGDLDVAYVAMSSSMDALRGLLDDGETYMYRGAGLNTPGFNNIAGQIELDKNGHCAGAHALSTTTDSTSTPGYVTYKYTCTACSAVINTRTIPSTLAFVNGTQLSRGNSISSLKGAADSTVPYCSINKTAESAYTGYGQVTVSGATLGEYVAIKYRTTGTAVVRLDFNLDGKAITGAQVIYNHSAEDWVVAIIRIGDADNYKALVEGGAETALMGIAIHNNTLNVELQVSYVAMGSLEDLRALLADGETYMYRGTNFANVAGQVEHNKDGTPVADG
jgi:hypothetical protein